ncbi:LamG domain-containing protein [Pilimelia columellifera]|uniref:LamG domain-containing protein n=1 Tax=Pilimelia columellifera TaxID=706574 RepID=UPI0031E18A1C
MAFAGAANAYNPNRLLRHHPEQHRHQLRPDPLIDSTGKLAFVVKPSGAGSRVVHSVTVNDGAWHHVAASVGAAGLKLYLDGELVATAATTSAANFTAYWRVGGNNLAGYTARPSSDHLTGTVDEVAVYHRQLTDNEVKVHNLART